MRQDIYEMLMAITGTAIEFNGLGIEEDELKPAMFCHYSGHVGVFDFYYYKDDRGSEHYDYQNHVFMMRMTNDQIMDELREIREAQLQLIEDYVTGRLYEEGGADDKN